MAKKKVFLEWDESFNCGVEIIDWQHRRLVDLLNILGEAIALGRSAGILGEIIGEMYHYADYHFRTEEKLMQDHHYPDYAAHKEIHVEFTHDLIKLLKRDAKGEADLDRALFRYITEWLLKHTFGDMDSADRQMGRFLNRCGIR